MENIEIEGVTAMGVGDYADAEYSGGPLPEDYENDDGDMPFGYQQGDIGGARDEFGDPLEDGGAIPDGDDAKIDDEGVEGIFNEPVDADETMDTSAEAAATASSAAAAMNGAQTSSHLRGRPIVGAIGKKTIVRGAARRSKPVMSDLEYAAVVGGIASHIEHGAIDFDQKILDKCKELRIDSSLDMAEVAIEMVEAPLDYVVHREVAPNVFEEFQIRELELPSQILCSTMSGDPSLIGLEGICPFDYNRALFTQVKKLVQRRGYGAIGGGISSMCDPV
jgi:hypothetical protein